ncbi:callose synthase 3-like isoform X3 [Arachis hypogaea]|uniref:callose synthase 3-like isoform X3 n=2 Tax=Arachis hypogaea TaxID=3818 RepID=UPI000DED09D7|nr:callose synthase 3-like isoform X4 [Arachis hypogaea]XP_025697024.1 callose synthase 3-like isoform X4 [Arachis hypogaea]
MPKMQRILRSQTAGIIGLGTFDSEVLPSSLVEIAPILRVANEVEEYNPRVAYLCRYYAFDKAHKLDPSSSGRGVRQYKTALLQRLERENELTLEGRVKSDARELQSFYQHYYQKYIQALQNAGDKADRESISKAYQTANIIFEVLKAVNTTQDMELNREILETQDEVVQTKKMFVPYNILPLDPNGANQAIMQFPEIQGAVYALRNIRGLPWPKDYKKNKDADILDWLGLMFGFQKDNVANQREHLILLLANVHIRKFWKPNQQSKLDERALTQVMKKLFKNYKMWCKYLGRKSSLWLPTIEQKVQQRKLLYMGLYLLIWGEAANLRLMPECLCYIYHHMAFELFHMLTIDPMTGENVIQANGCEKEAFLRKVVAPIYDVIAKEAERSKGGISENSEWRNYDDLNEYFWSADCFQLGWPMRADADFFCVPYKLDFDNDHELANRYRWIGKVNFVEIRSFWHIFRSFDRMWSFFILCLQVMIVVAWNGSDDPFAVSYGDALRVLTVFITAAILKLGQAILDIILCWKAKQNMSLYVKLRYILKVVSAAAWVFVLSVTYACTWDNPPGFAQTIRSWIGNEASFPSLFILAIVIYLSPNMLAAVFFLFPSIYQFLERLNYRIVMLMIWWSQPCLYVGRAMHESAFSRFKYTMFWALVIVTKLAFSYYIEIKPLVGPTKAMIPTFPNGFFPHAQNKKIGACVALWTPITLVYFMDTQIWYALFSTLFGGIYGAYQRIGEIRTLEMLRSRFHLLPGAFNANLFPNEKNDSRKKGIKAIFSRRITKAPSNKGKEAARFAKLWNPIITSFREEDLISNREMDLLLVPYRVDCELGFMQWPPFLLANKVQTAVCMARDSSVYGSDLGERIEADSYMSCAVRECYASLKSIIKHLVQGEHEKQAVDFIFAKIDSHAEAGTLINEFRMSAVTHLYCQFVELIKYLRENNKNDRDQVVILFLDMLEVVTRDLMMADELDHIVSLVHSDLDICQPFTSEVALRFPVVQPTVAWREKIERLYLLLTTKESAMDVPSNLEARRRISFFSSSLFMDIPKAPSVHNMLSFSVLTPHYREQVLFRLEDLETPNEDGLTILSYLQQMFPDEWTNFLERIKCATHAELRESEELEEELRLWASYRWATLTRTVRGMMYYKKALELQAFLDMSRDEDLMKGNDAMESSCTENSDTENSDDSLRGGRLSGTDCQAVADMKFTCVVSCQQYGIDKRSGSPLAQDILRLMKRYPSLRIAYIDEVEESGNDRQKKNIKVYYSCLVKVSDPHQALLLDQVIYRIKLPGPAILGVGKPENQNHAIIFTRGEGLQTVDMDQDNYMEEALKMRNLLQEFLKKHDGVQFPSILGLREHVFTESVSSLARFMVNRETSFATIGQRFLANPLKVRFHYGHSDVFDRLFHLTRGGVSKASKVVNLSEGIFAGFNTTLREGNVTHHEYIQVGKARDAGLNQISMFEAKIASGNGEQALSRDVYRLGHHFDFFRMLSCYFSTVGYHFSALITVITVYAFLYGRLYLVLNGEGLSARKAVQDNKPLQVALASQSLVQIGFLMVLPMFMEISLERGYRAAVSEFILMQFQLAPMFFMFSLGTTSHYFGRTLLHGGAIYRSTGQGVVVCHVNFADNYRFYSRSHFVKGIELSIVLVVYEIFCHNYRSDVGYVLINISMWFMAGTWLFAPFLFNPSGFEWQKIVDDWNDWNIWIRNYGRIGIPPEKSWESWWEQEQEHLRYSGLWGIVVEILLSLRFFIYQYGLVYHLNITKRKSNSFLIYGISWLVIFAIVFVTKILSAWRRKLSAKSQSLIRIINGLIFVTFVPIVTLIALPHMSMQDIVIFILAFVPTGWGMLQIAQALKPLVQVVGLWESVKTLARNYEMVMGLLLFTPVAFLSLFPFISFFQTRMLFNQWFSGDLQILSMFRGRRNARYSYNKRE